MPMIPESIQLEVSKAIEQLALVDKTYNLGLWPTEVSKQEWKHDLSVMRYFDDLEHVRLELLAADNTVLCEFRLAFNGSARGQQFTDSAKGVEVPLIDRRLVASQRAIVQWKGRQDQYKHLLRMPWSSAATLPRRTGDTYESEHAARITGGRQHGMFHVAAEARHRLVVTQVGTKGYAFAKDLDLNLDGVFLHQNWAPAGWQFRPGQQVTALVIQTPKGLQTRKIQVA